MCVCVCARALYPGGHGRVWTQVRGSGTQVRGSGTQVRGSGTQVRGSVCR